MRVMMVALALAAAGFLPGPAAAVGAARDRAACRDCGRPAPTILARTLYPTSETTRYHDVSVTRRVQRLRRVVTVTRIQPVFRIHDLTRIHHRTVVVTRVAERRDAGRDDPILAAVTACGCRP